MTQASTDRSALDAPQRTLSLRTANLLLVGALCAGLFRGFHTSALHGGGLFVDPYWGQYYLLNFKDGFHHRALVGSVLRTVFPHGVSMLVVNAMAIAALLTIAVTLFHAVRKAAGTSAIKVAAGAILLSSGVASVLVETLGDLLQICFAIAACAFLLCLRVRSTAVAATIAIAAAIACVWIHEASLLLLTPVLLLAVTRGRVRWPGIAVAALVTIALIGWNGLHNNAHGVLTYVGLTFPHHGVLGSSDEVNKGFSGLLQEEWKFFFATNKLRALWLIRFGGVFLPALASVLCMAYLLPRARFRNFVSLFTLLFAVSLPMYVIAHDWPRFLALTFALSLLAEQQLSSRTLSVDTPFSSLLSALGEVLWRWAAPVTTVIAVVLLLQLASEGDFRFWGMPAHHLLPLLPVLIACFIASRRAVRSVDPA